MRIDVVSVCFRAELALLGLQARAMDVFWDINTLQSYTIIVNDEESARECLAYIERWILPSLSPRLRSVTRILMGAEVLGDTYGRGWKRQQALKLAVARSVESSYYLVLDAKTHFTRPVSARHFFDDDGRPLAARRVYSPTDTQRYWLNASHRFLGATARKEGDLAAGVTVTPFLFHRQLVLNLLEHPAKVLKRLRIEMSKSTEFFVYYVYLEVERGGYFAWYSPHMPQQGSLFRTAPLNWDKIDRILELVDNDELGSFAVHRDRFPRLSARHYDAIVDLWSSRGLLRDEFVREGIEALRKG